MSLEENLNPNQTRREFLAGLAGKAVALAFAPVATAYASACSGGGGSGSGSGDASIDATLSDNNVVVGESVSVDGTGFDYVALESNPSQHYAPGEQFVTQIAGFDVATAYGTDGNGNTVTTSQLPLNVRPSQAMSEILQDPYAQSSQAFSPVQQLQVALNTVDPNLAASVNAYLAFAGNFGEVKEYALEDRALVLHVATDPAKIYGATDTSFDGRPDFGAVYGMQPNNIQSLRDSGA